MPSVDYHVLFLVENLPRDVNTLLNGDTTVGLNTLNAINDLYTNLGGKVLGIIPTAETSSSDGKREAGLVELLIDMRARARTAKNYAESDRIRDELLKLGVVLEDRADGTVWKLN